MNNFDQKKLANHHPVSLRNFVSFLFKRKKIIITFFITVVSVTTIGSFVVTPIFQAESKIIVEKELDSEKALLFRMDIPKNYTQENVINSEMEIMHSFQIIS
ncbi:Wzz/FepE/Etk N-terminal domain-containing protein, partial [Calditrichota bacterium]